jgi:hypothetical protein
LISFFVTPCRVASSRHFETAFTFLPSNALRQVFRFQLKADRVIPRVSEVGEPIRHSQYKEDDGVVCHRNAGIALFDFDQRRPADGRARRSDRGGNPPPPPSILYIATEFP